MSDHYIHPCTPIGDYLYCTGFFAAKRAEFTKLLSKLEDVSDIDPQVAFNLLRLCSGFCKMVHLARSTPLVWLLIL